jgi:fucose permease
VVQHSKTDRLAVGIAFFSFAVLGVPGAMLNVAWSPSIRTTFGLSLAAVGTLLLVGMLGYAAASFASGRLIGLLGVARLLAFCAVLGTVGSLGLALAPEWWVMVLFSLLLGTGAGLLDGAMNIYFAANYGPRLMNWLHASFGVGATLAPLAITAILKYGGSWRLGYGLAAFLYGVLVVLFMMTAGRWRLSVSGVGGSDQTDRTDLTQHPTPNTLVVATVWETLQLPLVWLGIGLFLAYTGLENSAGQWSFSLLTESRHAAPEIAGVWVSIYWGSFTAGRIFFGAIVKWVQPAALIRGCLAGAVLGAALLGWKALGSAAFLGLALFGFSLAPIFALMITGTQERLGPVHAQNAIGFQVGAAALGVGILPGLAGVLAKNRGLEIIPPFLLAVTALIIVLFETIHYQRSRVELGV